MRIEHRIPNPGVAGSNAAGRATQSRRIQREFRRACAGLPIRDDVHESRAAFCRRLGGAFEGGADVVRFLDVFRVAAQSLGDVVEARVAELAPWPERTSVV